MVRTNEWAVDGVGKKAECTQGSSLLMCRIIFRERERERGEGGREGERERVYPTQKKRLANSGKLHRTLFHTQLNKYHFLTYQV